MNLEHGLVGLILEHGLVGLILDFQVNRTQRVRVNGVFSDEMRSSTESPQGCVCLLYYLSFELMTAVASMPTHTF